MSFPVFRGSNILASPQTVSVATTSSSTVNVSYTPLGADSLYIYITLPTGVTASVTIGGQSVPLTSGSNRFLIPTGVPIGNITINNAGATAASVTVWALFTEVV